MTEPGSISQGKVRVRFAALGDGAMGNFDSLCRAVELARCGGAHRVWASGCKVEGRGVASPCLLGRSLGQPACSALAPSYPSLLPRRLGEGLQQHPQPCDFSKIRHVTYKSLKKVIRRAVLVNLPENTWLNILRKITKRTLDIKN